MDFAKSKRWHPADFLEFWVDDKIPQQAPNLSKAKQFANNLVADAATQPFTLADLGFNNDAEVIRHMTQAMAAPHD